MMRNFLLLSLLVVACYANRAILRTSGGQVADVYTMWKYGLKDGYANWTETKLFLVKFEKVQNPKAFIDEFNKQGHDIAQEYGTMIADFKTFVEFQNAMSLSDFENLNSEANIFATINLSNKSQPIQINERRFTLKDSYGLETEPFLSFIRSKAASFLQGSEKALQA
eukprot:Platyproteum_vivax@DN7077_c0_g1_i3.p1